MTIDMLVLNGILAGGKKEKEGGRCKDCPRKKMRK